MARALVKNASVANPPNLLINGGFDIWQRIGGNTSGNIDGIPSYDGPDRWMTEATSISGLTMVRSADVPLNSQLRYSARFNQNSVSGSQGHRYWQRIEASAIRPYIGQYMTLSFWIKGNVSGGVHQVTAHVPVSEDTWQAENTSETAIYTSSTETTTTTWTRFSHTFLVPSTAFNGLCVGIVNTTPVGTGYLTLMTGAMLTEGVAAPAHFYRAGDNLQEELAMCQRYYEKSYELDTAPGSVSTFGYALVRAVSSTAIGTASIPFKVQKRVSPTITLFTHSGVSGKWLDYRGQDAINGSGFGISPYTYAFLVFDNAVTAGLTTGDAVELLGEFTADAEL